MGPAIRPDPVGGPRNDGEVLMSTLSDFSGTLVLVGAGKMGGAMLQGWLALGLDPQKIAVVEPRPADEIAALAARGVRINGTVEDASVIVIAIKPQDAATVVPTLKSLTGPARSRSRSWPARRSPF